MDPEAAIHPVVKDAIAPTTTPLLKLLVHYAKSTKNYSDWHQSHDSRAFRKVVREDPPPLKDESEQLRDVLLKVIKEGMSPCVSGKTVSRKSTHV
jgi:hypothetical protein